MFKTDYLISIGQLPDVLDGKGTILHVLRWEELHDKRFSIEASLTIQRECNLLQDHIGFIIPTISAFDKVLIDTLKRSSSKLRKVLVATTEVREAKPIHYELGQTYVAERFGSSLPSLRGCAQLVPFSDAEKLICDIHGISYEG